MVSESSGFDVVVVGQRGQETRPRHHPCNGYDIRM
jgi:hypothetical protein